MSEENLGRVQGAGFFFSTAVSSTSADMATISPSTIKPVYGDNIIFANGDIRNITAVSDTAVTCGGVVANLQGPDGVHIISSVLQGQDADGGNIYLQTFSDNTTATFTAPRGLEGLGILYSSADADAQTTLFAKDSVTIPAGREIKVGDIILCNAHLFSVNAVSETSFSVIHLAYFSTDSAQKDGNGNVIVDTYATKTQLSDGSVTKIGTSTVGSSTKPIYLNAGVPTAGTYTLGAACAKSVSDSSSASALSSTDTNVPTVRDIYYGLPSINGDHTYTSDTTIYAPTSAGSDGQLLTTSGSGAPTWTSKATVISSGSSAPVTSGAVYTALTDGSVTKIGNTLTIGTTAYDGSAAVNAGRRSWYGTCTTAEATSAKEVSDCTGFVLETGAKVSIRFGYANSASEPTLNVNSTGAKSIRSSHGGVGTLTYRWAAGQVVDFVYDGTYWLLQQPWIATTAAYGVSKVASLSLNGSPSATPSFYAPKDAGTSGYFLKSNGSGKAPTWVDLPGTWTLSNTGIWLSENLSNPQTGHVILPYNATYNFIINFGITKANTNQNFSKPFSRVLFAFTTTDHTSDHLSQRSHITALTTKGITLGDNANVWVRWFVGGLVSKS